MADAFYQDTLVTPDGAALHFEIHGQGDPAVALCDGLGCDGFAWRYLLPDLKRSHRVLHWHYRGHGKSGMPLDPRRVGILYTCDDLALILDRAGIREAAILGHSMGVQVALEFHRRHAGRVLALGLLCGSYGHPLDTLHDGTQVKTLFPFARWLVERFPGASAALTHQLLGTELALQVGVTLELNRQRLRKEDIVPYFAHLAKMDPLVFMRTLASLAEHSAWDHLPFVTVPTRVVGGGRDHFTPFWLSRRMADAIPGAQLLALPEGSHTALLEFPEPVGRVVRRLVDEQVVCQARAASV